MHSATKFIAGHGDVIVKEWYSQSLYVQDDRPNSCKISNYHRIPLTDRVLLMVSIILTHNAKADCRWSYRGPALSRNTWKKVQFLVISYLEMQVTQLILC